MDITFILGNGFDLNLGLKTRYEDFYPYFKVQASSTNLIKSWLENETNIKLWSDYEKRLGELLVKIDNDQVDKFIESKEEADDLLSSYIEIQQSSIEDTQYKDMQPIFINGLISYFDNLCDKDKNKIINLLNNYKSEKFQYNIIIFNYSNTVEQLLFDFNKSVNSRKVGSMIIGDNIGKILHIHGTTIGEKIVGVNDSSQIANKDLRDNEYLLSSFTKDLMNETIGQNKVSISRNIINNSKIIVIYGLSRGKTDKNRWKDIINWCLSDPLKLLLIYEFTAGIEKERVLQRVPSILFRNRNSIIQELIELGEINENQIDKLKNRIIVFYNNIFNFSL